MTMRYLMDTDRVIHYPNGHSDIIRRLHELQPEGSGLSVNSLAGLYEGIYRQHFERVEGLQIESI